MADQKVIITSTNTNGQTFQKTLTDINPDAGNTELKTFAQMLYAMTDNTYGKTDRVIKINCDTESGGGGKQTPTLTLSNTSCTVSQLKDSGVAAGDQYLAGAIITTNSDGALFVKQANLPAFQAVATSIITRPDDVKVFSAYSVKDTNGQTQAVPQTVTIYQAESDTYKAAEVTFTITA